MKNKKFAQIVSTKNTVISINSYQREISNTNELLGVLNGVTGVKTGFTNNAGRCLVTSVNRNGWEIIVIVLRADTKKNRTTDSVKIIEYIYKNYQQVNIKKQIDEKFNNWCRMNLKRIQIDKARNSKIQLSLSDLQNQIIPVKNTKIDSIDINVNSLLYFVAPVAKNSTFGTVGVIVDNEVVDVLRISNIEEIQRKSIENYLIQFLEVFVK